MELRFPTTPRPCKGPVGTLEVLTILVKDSLDARTRSVPLPSEGGCNGGAATPLPLGVRGFARGVWVHQSLSRRNCRTHYDKRRYGQLGAEIIMPMHRHIAVLSSVKNEKVASSRLVTRESRRRSWPEAGLRMGPAVLKTPISALRQQLGVRVEAKPSGSPATRIRASSSLRSADSRARFPGRR
jgi:hypothetical protein